MSPAYYALLGFAVPGAARRISLAAPDRRVIALVGDGSFQMTGMEISTAARCGLAPIVLVLNNGGYGTFRSMIDGPFNDLCPGNMRICRASSASAKDTLRPTKRSFK